MKRYSLELFLIALATIARLIPHPWNFTPLGSFAIYAGAKRPVLSAILVPLSVLFISDLYVGFYNPIVMVFVYLGFLAMPTIARLFLKSNWKQGRWLAVVGLGAVVFYLLSNFGVWAAGYYPPTLAGLIAAYFAGLPFLGISFIGDAFYTFVIFNVSEIVEKRSAWGGVSA